jgi:hypothetical protein
MQSLRRLPTAPTRPMAEPTTAERAFIMELTMVVRPTGMMASGVRTARGVATPDGTMARDTPEDGAEAPLHGMMVRGMSAAFEVARPRGAVAPAPQRDGGAERLHGAVAPVPSMGLLAARAHGDVDEMTAK